MNKKPLYKSILFNFNLIDATPIGCMMNFLNHDSGNIISKRGQYLLSRGNKYLREYLKNE
jgi:hypothetical protein